MKVVILSTLRSGRFYLPRRCVWYSFLLQAKSTPQSHRAAERIKLIKKIPNDTVGNGSRDLNQIRHRISQYNIHRVNYVWVRGWYCILHFGISFSNTLSVTSFYKKNSPRIRQLKLLQPAIDKMRKQTLSWVRGKQWVKCLCMCVFSFEFCNWKKIKNYNKYCATHTTA
jgi:hypothetical protein